MFLIRVENRTIQSFQRVAMKFNYAVEMWWSSFIVQQSIQSVLVHVRATAVDFGNFYLWEYAAVIAQGEIFLFLIIS